ncbi:MATE family efflux transporter [Bacillus sp. OAE603]|uniref:MATE family efflux transporter n=1 Tax=Gottfriedia sp. OAE603 TaxID=2663872 RepID=UPI00178B3E09
MFKPKNLHGNQLTDGPIARTLFFFSMPMLLGNVLQSLNGSINSIWVGKFLGEQALAATSNANILMFFLSGAIFGISMAAVILIAQNIGAKNISEAKRVVGTSLALFIALSLIVAFIGFVFSPTILKLMNTPGDAINFAISYTRMMFLGTPFMFAYTLVMAIMRGSGDSKTPFYFLLLSVGLDIILNPLFIKGIGPFPEMGISGSGFASLIAQTFSFVLLVLTIYSKKYFLRLQKEELNLIRFDWGLIKVLIIKGIPMGLQMIVVSSANLALFHLVNSFGSESTAAFGVAFQLSSYIQMPAMAIGGAVTSMVAQCIGAGKLERIGRIALIGVLFNVIWTGGLVLLLNIFSKQAFSLFLPTTGHAIDLGMTISYIMFWPYILFGVTLVLSGVVRSTGAVMPPLLFTFCAMWLVRNPFAYYLGHQYGFLSIWWSFGTAFTVAVLCHILYYFFGNWKKATFQDGPKGRVKDVG